MEITFKTKDYDYIKKNLSKILEIDFIDPNTINYWHEHNWGESYSESLLHRACHKGWIDIVKMFLECDNIDLNDIGRSTALIEACYSGNMDLIKLILYYEDVIQMQRICN